MQESNCWRVPVQQRANSGVLHSECSDASSDSRKVALTRTTILQHPTAWRPPEHPCSSTRRSMLDRDCRRAQPFNGMARTVRLSLSTSSRTMRSVEHVQNPLRILFSRTTPAMSPALIFHLPPLECSIFIRRTERCRAARYGVPVRCDHRRCQQVRKYVQQATIRLQS